IGLGRAALLGARMRVDDVVIGLLDAAAGLVHQPAVVVAADAGLLDEAIGEIRASMGAVPIKEPETSALVLVEHEILAHQANGLDRVLVEFARAADRHPVAAQKLSHGCARADLGQKAVLFGTQHALPRCSLVALCRLLLEFPTAATAIYDVARRRIALLGRAMEHKPQKRKGRAALGQAGVSAVI